MNLRSVAILLFLAAAVHRAGADSGGEGLQGLYLTVDGGAQVSVFRADDGTYGARIVWLKVDKARLDVNNPDPKRRGDPVLGLVILRGLKAAKEADRWEGGEIYDPKNGKTYDCYVWRDPVQPGLLHLKGYVLGIRWLGRSTSWTAEARPRD